MLIQVPVFSDQELRFLFFPLKHRYLSEYARIYLAVRFYSRDFNLEFMDAPESPVDGL